MGLFGVKHLIAVVGKDFFKLFVNHVRKLSVRKLSLIQLPINVTLARCTTKVLTLRVLICNFA